jgi:hypothetical protein
MKMSWRNKNMDLLEKLGNVEIKTIDRFPPEDMEYCRQAEKDYHDAYNIYSEFSYIVEDINVSVKALPDNLYVQTIDENRDKIYDCNERFIDKICGYFRQKYTVTVEAPEWKIVDEERGRSYTKERYDAVPLKYILDSVYEQMGGMSFEEKAFSELKETAKEALADHHGKSKYCVKGAKLTVGDFYRSYKDSIWARYMATVYAKHRAFFKALTHFEYGRYEISQKYGFLCDYKIDEQNGVYDKHYISSAVIDTVRVYKNGKVEIEFKNYKTVSKFISIYFPGIPQKTAA